MFEYLLSVVTHNAVVWLERPLDLQRGQEPLHWKKWQMWQWSVDQLVRFWGTRNKFSQWLEMEKLWNCSLSLLLKGGNFWWGAPCAVEGHLRYILERKRHGNIDWCSRKRTCRSYVPQDGIQVASLPFRGLQTKILKPFFYLTITQLATDTQ